MRKLVLVLAVVFAATIITAAIVAAATSTTKSGQTTVAKKQVAKTAGKTVAKPAAKKKSMPSKAARGPSKKFYKGYKITKKASMRARMGSGPKRHYAKRSCKLVCKPRVKAKRMARPARAARGPAVTCPAPVVNVPQQAAPIVNVPQQPAPVVNVPANPPSTAISVDSCNIYIVRNNQLTILDKNTYQVKQTVPLQ